MKRWAFYPLLGMLPVPGGCGVKQAAGHRILTHKTVQAAQGKAPQEVKPVPVEPSVLSKGMEKDSQGNIIYPYFAMKYDIAREEKMFPYERPDIVAGDAYIRSSLSCIVLPDMFYCLLWGLCGNLILLVVIEHVYIFRNLRSILYVIEPSDSLMREMTAPIAFSLQISSIFGIISIS